jgi:sugar phosphate isomerase/epimerase
LSKTVGWKLGIITDEIAESFDRSLGFIGQYGLEWCELRQVWGKNVMNLSSAELRRAKELIQRFNLKVSQIGSPVFKYNLPQMPARAGEKRDTFRANFTDQDSDRLLHESFRLAHFFGTNKVRVFSYWRVDEPQEAYPYVLDRLAQAAEMAGRNGVLLTLENEHECNIATGKELGRLLRDVSSPHLRGTWDPANAAMQGETPYPDGYLRARGLIEHLHVKDLRKNLRTYKLEWAPVGKGFIDWEGQFEALRRHGYNCTVSLETHYRKRGATNIESTRISLEGLLKILYKTGPAI